MITLQHIYWLAGLYLLRMAWLCARDRANPRRFTSGLFWALIALSLLAGELLPPALMGAVVMALALLAGLGGVRAGRVPAPGQAELQARATQYGHRLFVPALLIPVVTVAIALSGDSLSIGGTRLLGAQQTTLIGLGLGCLIGLLAVMRLTRCAPATALDPSRALLEAISWAALLPLLLATLGGVFAAAGVGEAVAEVVRAVIPVDNRLAVVLAYALGMAAFTMVMGNAFAAFPVITAGIGLPLLVQGHGADPAPLAAIGMLSGYCGTLMTPMAANYNLVPAALLELRDPYAVIRVQVPTALCLLGANCVLMYWLALPAR